MLYRSLDGEKYSSYKQFESIRKLRSAYLNTYHALAVGVSQMTSLGRDTSKVFLTKSLTQSLWFERFANGCVRRMGQEVRQDLAITAEVMHKLLEGLYRDWAESEGWKRREIEAVGAKAITAFCGSFRGHAVFLVDLHGLLKYQEEIVASGEARYVIIPLLGQFKGEDGSRYHLTPLASITRTGLETRKWVFWLCDALRKEPRSH